MDRVCASVAERGGRSCRKADRTAPGLAPWILGLPAQFGLRPTAHLCANLTFVGDSTDGRVYVRLSSSAFARFGSLGAKHKGSGLARAWVHSLKENMWTANWQSDVRLLTALQVLQVQSVFSQGSPSGRTRAWWRATTRARRPRSSSTARGRAGVRPPAERSRDRGIGSVVRLFRVSDGGEQLAVCFSVDPRWDTPAPSGSSPRNNNIYSQQDASSPRQH